MSSLGFSTRTGVQCPACRVECRFVEPTDVLAARPIRVQVTCPHCHVQGTTILQDHDRESMRPWSMLPRAS